MSDPQPIPTQAAPSFRLSLDAWAVFIAFAVAGFVRFGILKHVPW